MFFLFHSTYPSIRVQVSPKVTPKDLEVVMAAMQGWFVKVFIYIMHPINEFHQYESISNQCVVYL